MIGQSESLVAFMDGHDKRFIIPVYQRNYDWKKEHCKKLFDDLLKIVKTGKRHFFGSIVAYSHKREKISQSLIIDGQQRLTTVSLLLLAIHNLLRTNQVNTQDDNLKDKILDVYLIDKYHPIEKRIKLKPVKNDEEAFNRLFDDDAVLDEKSNITVNYKYFLNRLLKEGVPVDQIYEAIQNLDIIVIGLGEEDNPQLIFESINSTGLELSEGDKIRNYVLMNLSPDLQDTYYLNYWNKIEVNTRFDVSSFVRDYLTLKQSKIPNQKRVYFDFKEFKESIEDQEDFDLENFLKELLVYSKRYSILLKGNDTSSRPLKASIERLNWLETTVTRPFFLEVLRLMDEGLLSIKEVEEIFNITESYLYRRMVCGIKTNSLNKLFASLHKEIIRFDGTSDNYVEKFKYVLLNKKSTNKFVSDETFGEFWKQKDFYHMNSKPRIYTFERLTNAFTTEDIDVYEKARLLDFSVEHIMPQTLNDAWKKELGPNALEIHEKWIDRIANLTITGNNSAMGNKPFAKKRDILLSGNIRLNKYFEHVYKWDLEELEKRNNVLLDSAKKIWPVPTTKFEPQKEPEERFALDEETDFTHTNPIKFYFNGEVHVVKSWKDLFVKVFGMFYQKDPSIFNELLKSGASYINTDKTKLRIPAHIDEEKRIFLEVNSPTAAKVDHLLELCKLYDEDPSNIEIVIQSEKKEEDMEDID